MHLISFKK